MKKFLLLLAAVGAIFTACENFSFDNPQLPIIEVVGGEDALTLNFPSDGMLAKTVTFKSNYDWSVTTSEEWIKISPESGEAGEECQITVSLDRNDTGETRSGKVTISIDELSIDLAVTQSNESADAAIPNNEIWYTSSNGKVVTPKVSNAFGAKIVSNTYADGKGVIQFDGNVTQIGEQAYINSQSLTSITLPNSVTSIDSWAFANCISLTSIVVSENISTIKAMAFQDCSSLTTITIPDSISKIEESAFTHCNSLEAFYCKFASEDNRCLIVDKILVAFAPAGLTEYTIPDTVSKIGYVSFANSRSLVSVTIPNSVTEIGFSAFVDCTSLASVTIPDSISSIKNTVNPFMGCTSLEAFYGKFASSDNRCLIDDGVIVSFAPAGLTEYAIPDGVTQITNNAFRFTTSIVSITIPDSVTAIGSYSFENCISLESVYCKPTTPPTGGQNMFYNNASSRKIYVPTASVEAYKSADYWKEYADYIEGYNFENGEVAAPQPANNEIWYTSSDGAVITPYKSDVFGANIVSSTYENGKGVITFDGVVTQIGEQAFYSSAETRRLASITIPNSVTKIGKKAFYSCSSLTSVTIPDSVTSIENRAFMGCSSLTNITIPDSVISIEECVFLSCNSLTTFYGKFASADNKCLIVDGLLNSFADGCGATEYTIPDSVTSIGTYAFSGCKSLTSVTIPNSVIEIGHHAFSYCTSLTSITIPNSVTSIGESAFRDCTSLTSVTIPNSVTSIGEGAFSRCASLEKFYGKFASADNCYLIVNGVLNSFAISCDLAEFTIPNSVTSIGKYAFEGCKSLTSVTIPDSVISIGYWAFYGCTSLTSVYCKPTTPPTGYSYMFNSNASGRKIYVPAASVEAYKAAEWWSDYASDIVRYDFEKGEVVNVYSEITYTSSDGKIVTPYAANVFSANIVSNTYENGKGVIKFDGEVSQIGEKAFYNCATLTSISIPNTIYLMNKDAFSGCKNLKRVDISDLSAWCRITFKHSASSSPLYNGADLYLNGELLVDLVIPSDISALKFGAFFGCTSLKSVTIPSYVTLIGHSAFAKCTSLTNVTMDYGVATLGISAFSGCTSLTNITIPDSVTSIERNPFYLCTSLKAFYGKFTSDDNRCLIVDGVLHSFAPAGLTEYTIPDSATSIESGFSSCTLLTSVTIPNSVTSIRYEAFHSCNNLISVYCKPTTPPTALLTSLGSWSTFNMNAPGRKIYVPTASVEAYKAASGWSGYASDIVGYDF